MTAQSTGFGFSISLHGPFPAVVERVKVALKEEGLGVVSELDVQDTLRQKSDYRIRPYLILGVCNPQLAARAIEIEPEIGLLLPCNVLLQEQGDAIRVSAQDPRIISQLTGNPDLDPIAQQAYLYLRHALARLEEESS